MTADYRDLTDEQLILLLRSGEAPVMEYLLEKYKPMVRKKANMLYLIGGDTEDLIQEGMIGLFRAIRDFDPDKNAGFATFSQICVSRQLYRALENDSRKKNQPLNTALSISSGEDGEGPVPEGMLLRNWDSPETIILENERLEEFRQKLEKSLSRMEKEVLSLYLEGNPYTRIAEMTGRTPKAIDNALQRIRGKVRQIIG